MQLFISLLTINVFTINRILDIIILKRDSIINPLYLCYDLVLSVIFVNGFYSLSMTRWLISNKANVVKKIIFLFLSIISSTTFRLLDETQLRSLVIVDGWWNHINILTKIVVVSGVSLFFLLILYQINVIKNIECENYNAVIIQSFVPIIIFLSIYIIILIFTIIENQYTKFHFHHSIISSFVFFLFPFENYNKINFIVRSTSLGIIIQGMSIYSLSEWELFNNESKINFHSIYPLCIFSEIIFFSTIIYLISQKTHNYNSITN